jgi:hypothetical protein
MTTSLRSRSTSHLLGFMLASEGAVFGIAALAHTGVLLPGYAFPDAAIPESVIGIVLVLGAGLTWLLPDRARPIAIGAQAFALVGTLIGAYVSVIGIGPSTVPDRVFHVGMLAVLFSGLVIAVRGGVRGPGSARLAAIGVVQMLIRASGLLQLALGIAFWTGTLLVAVPFHIFNGLIFSILLEAQAGLAFRSGVSRRLVVLSVAWGLLLPAFGFTQTQILPGDWHWLVRVVHLAIGVAAMAFAERLARDARSRYAMRRQGSRANTGAP